jgi:hypothetical protein
MSYVEKAWNWIAHGVGLVGIITFQDAKSLILFSGSVILFSLQARLNYLKIKKAKQDLE